MTNQLSAQTSPYLLQHAENPVDWQPWGEPALRQAREMDKPILLSIGYSACHWCHVMERECFEDETIAAQMNDLFVCIKVDREERPDLDKIYQNAHQMLTRRPGGWPLTVALTPGGHAPFFAGTYFPPQPRMGMPGFPEALEKVAAHYRKHRRQMTDHHRSFEQAMAQLNPHPSEATPPATAATLDKAAAELAGQFDREFGGFGNAPKFPHPTQLELLLRHNAQSKQNRIGVNAQSKQDHTEVNAQSKQDHTEVNAQSKQDRTEVNAQNKQDRAEVNAQSKQDRTEVNAQNKQDRAEVNAQSKQDRAGVNAQSKQDRAEVNAQSRQNHTEVNAQSEQDRTEVNAQSKQDRAGESAHILSLTLRKMAEGGLFDQLGGGFYRYSVDRQWRIPHFEKMLYDNAQLLALYADAWQYFRDPLHRAVVEQTADWVVREMQQSHGGYASTLDADSEGVEGKYYVWSETDLRALLTAAEYAALEKRYTLAGEPNFEGNWHLTVNPDTNPDTADSDKQNASQHKTTAHAIHPPDAALQTARAKLLAERARRVRPALDDKILTAWNGMMIKGMARAAGALGRDDFAQSACDALDFIRANLWQDGRLRVTWRNGEARLNGYLDDYAFLAEGIVELLQTKWRSADLNFAVQLCDAMLEHFEDPQAGGFFFTSHDHEKLIHRPKTGPDDAIPSGNGAAVRTLYKLGHLLGNSRYLESAEKSLRLFAPALAHAPSVYGSLSMALQAREPANKTIIIRGHGKEMLEWQSHCRRHYHPEYMALAIPAKATGLPDALAQRKPHRKTIAYICRGNACSAPIESVEEMEAQLAGDWGRAGNW